MKKTKKKNEKNLKSNYNLFLDDVRIPSKVKWIELPLVEWKIVRNYTEFVNTIKKLGVPTIVSFDHDLSDEHYKEFTNAHAKLSPSFGEIRYNKFKEKSGYDCAKWLVEYCINTNTAIPKYYIHTLNPIGKTNIQQELEFGEMYLETYNNLPDNIDEL